MSESAVHLSPLKVASKEHRGPLHGIARAETGPGNEELKTLGVKTAPIAKGKYIHAREGALRWRDDGRTSRVQE